MSEAFAFLSANAGYVVSVFTTLFAVASMQFKSMKHVIICQLLANGLLFLQYLLENRISAGGVVIVALLQTVVSFFFTYKKKRFPVWLTGIFMLAFAAVSILTYTTPLDLIPLAAVCFFAIAIVQKNSAICRICSAVNCILWLSYDIACAPSAILTHAIILAFIVVGILRQDSAEWCAFFARLFGKKKEDAHEERP